jgi:hypothetical protein
MRRVDPIQKQLGKEFRQQQKRDIYKSDSPRQAKVKKAYRGYQTKLQDTYLNQAVAKDPFLKQSIENEARAGRKVSQYDKLKTSGYFEKYPKGTPDMYKAKGIARDVDTSNKSIMGRIKSFQEQSDILSTGKKARRLSPKYRRIVKNQAKARPTLNPSDMTFYAKERARNLGTRVSDVVKKRKAHYSKEFLDNDKTEYRVKKDYQNPADRYRLK